MIALNRAQLVLAVSLVLATVPLALRAQDTSSTANLRTTRDSAQVQLVLRDGSTLLGRVLEVTPTTVRFVSSFGETSIPRISIMSVRVVHASAMHGGEYWPADPSRSRLFFAPTGRMLHSGESYFADAYVFFPSIQVGVSDRFSIGGGLSIFPGVSLNEQIFYLTPKIGVYSSPKVNVAVGALIAGADLISDQSPVGLGYGVATFGGEDGNVTTGAGFGFSRGNTSSTALLMLGGSRRVSKGIALVTENYFTSNVDAGFAASGGVRFMSEHIAVDVALFGGNHIDTVVPYLAFIYKW
jgi:hypothetical protein